MHDMQNDTIVAIATPPGFGGVGIVRLSGPLALDIAQSLTHKSQFSVRHAHFVEVFDAQNTVLDKGIALYFKAPASFTGEDVVELQMHGSPVVLDLIVKHALFLGARIARPGEFSERAFLNDKMDLTQAEAIADLIHASSERAAKMALNSLSGAFSERVNALLSKLIELRMYVEAALDFPEEEIDFLGDGVVSDKLQNLFLQLQEILKQAKEGALLREGLTVVIAGPPNAGKSTLINQLSGQDVAIVSDVAGTTRDVMREQILLDDIPVQLIDTAGLRDTEDAIEQEGVRRAKQAIMQADCVLLVLDIRESEQNLPELSASLPKDIPVIRVLNKIDLKRQEPFATDDEIYLSAKQGVGIELLKNTVLAKLGYQPEEGIFTARRRHLDALNKTLACLEQGKTALHNQRAGELLAEDLRQAQDALSEITGEFYPDDLLGKIFSSFCIGK